MTASSIPSKRDRYDGKLSALAYDGSDKSHECELRTFIPAFNNSVDFAKALLIIFSKRCSRPSVCNRKFKLSNWNEKARLMSVKIIIVCRLFKPTASAAFFRQIFHNRRTIFFGSSAFALRLKSKRSQTMNDGRVKENCPRIVCTNKLL